MGPPPEPTQGIAVIGRLFKPCLRPSPCMKTTRRAGPGMARPANGRICSSDSDGCTVAAPVRTVALNPAPDRRMVRLQTALGEQLFDIAERERVPKTPAEGAENEFGCRPPPLKDRRSRHILHGLFTLAATPCQTCNTSILSTGASNSVGWITRQEGRIQGCSYRCGQCVQSEWLRNVRQPTFNDASMSD